MYKLTTQDSKKIKANAEAVNDFLHSRHKDIWYATSAAAMVCGHIFDVGHKALREITPEELEENVKTTYENDAKVKEDGHVFWATPEFLEALMRAAVDLCKNFDIYQILSYARTILVF